MLLLLVRQLPGPGQDDQRGRGESEPAEPERRAHPRLPAGRYGGHGSLPDGPVRFAFNADWRNGMGSSIALGISKLSPPLDGAAIVPGDMPFLSPGLIETLTSKFEEFGGKPIVFPTTLSGRQRNPVIWPRRFFGLLEGLNGQDGGKKLLMELTESCAPIAIADERQLLDIDEPCVP